MRSAKRERPIFSRFACNRWGQEEAWCRPLAHRVVQKYSSETALVVTQLTTAALFIHPVDDENTTNLPPPQPPPPSFRSDGEVTTYIDRPRTTAKASAVPHPPAPTRLLHPSLCLDQAGNLPRETPINHWFFGKNSLKPHSTISRPD